MKKTISVFLILLSLSSYGQNELSAVHEKAISEFVNCFKNNDINKLCAKINYPLNRENPLPSIKNCADLQKRFNEVFDKNIVAQIINSDIKKDWSAVGWRGIMFLSGDIWLDYDGKLIGVNYQSEAEKKHLETLITDEKKILNESIQNYFRPIYLIQTSKFKIRIDDMSDNTYRYASWAKNADMKSQPSLIVENGKLEIEGTGGNHRFLFKKNEFLYEIDIIEIGENSSPPAILTVKKNNKTILSQNGIILKK